MVAHGRSLWVRHAHFGHWGGQKQNDPFKQIQSTNNGQMAGFMGTMEGNDKKAEASDSDNEEASDFSFASDME